MSQNTFTRTQSGRTLFKNQKHIQKQSTALAEEQLAFLDGVALGDIDIFSQSGETCRKVRRIVEKRVCQEMHRKHSRKYEDNWTRFNGKRRVTNQLKNIYGGFPGRLAA